MKTICVLGSIADCFRSLEQKPPGRTTILKPLTLYMARQYTLPVLFVLLLTSSSRSQEHSWIITIATGDTLSHCSLTSLDSDSLHIVWSGFPVSLPLESIHKIQHHRESEFWTGAGYGSLAGGTLATILSVSTHQGDGRGSAILGGSMIGIATGFIVGGMAAEYLSRDERFDLSTSSVPEKKTVLEHLLLRFGRTETGRSTQ